MITKNIFDYYEPPLKCRCCDFLEFRTEDNTKAFDCGNPIKGFNKIEGIFFCKNFIDEVDPKNCKEEI